VWILHLTTKDKSWRAEVQSY